MRELSQLQLRKTEKRKKGGTELFKCAGAALGNRHARHSRHYSRNIFTASKNLPRAKECGGGEGAVPNHK